MSIEQKITKSGTYYPVNLTKEQIIFLSAILRNMSLEQTKKLLMTPTLANIFQIKEWYWDTFYVKEWVGEEFLDELYGSIHSVAKQFKPQ